MFEPSIDIEESDNVINCRQVIQDSGLENITALVDTEYRDINTFLDTRPHQEIDKNHPANAYKNIMDRLSTQEFHGETLILLDGRRLVVPYKARKISLKHYISLIGV